MKFRTLIRRSLSFHWRSHLGVVLGATIGSAALIGALVVGDSVKESLRERALQNLGMTEFALDAHDRFLSEELSQNLVRDLYAQTKAARSTNREMNWFVRPMFHANAVASTLDGTKRVNVANLYAGQPPDPSASGSIWSFFNDDPEFRSPVNLARNNLLKAQTSTNQVLAQVTGIGSLSDPAEDDAVFLNGALAAQLGLKIGDMVLLRFPKPTALSSEAVISPRSEQSVSLRLRIGAIVPEQDTGNFSLRSSPIPPLNAFITPHTLTNLTGHTFRPNILTAAFNYGDVPGWAQTRAARRLYNSTSWFDGLFKFQLHSFSAGQLDQELDAVWTLADAQAVLLIDTNKWLELRSERVFLDAPLAAAAKSADQNAVPILTFLANLLKAGTNATPYSMVTAAGAPWTPADLRDDEIVVSEWLANDLHVKPGDPIALSYFLPESGAKLTEATNVFRVRSIAFAEMPWVDRTLMPDFPGIENAESTSEWDAGFPLTYKIRPQDEDYWKKFRGTPKAFITLAAGQKIWGNRFGNLTAIRFPVNASNIDLSKNTLEKKILANLKPEDLGMRFEPVREQALKAAEESQDFGGLFLGFSFFLIIAALLLMAMLFQFGLEQRAPEIGTLLALGFTVKQVRKLLLREGITLAFIGGIIGTVGGIYFAQTMLHALITIWKEAVGATALSFHYTAQTLAIGLLSSVIVSAITIWLALRKFVKRPARELLAGDIATTESRIMAVRYKVVAIVALLSAIGLVGWALAKHETANAEIFFSAGSLILIAGLGYVSAWLARKTNTASATGSDAQPTLGALALRGCARRRKRSLATVAMLACGSFLIVSIGVFRLDANVDATKKSSGTGGFALLGETTMPVVHDMNSQAGRDFFALNENDLKDVHFVPFRVRAGDEASCLNLNAAQKPRLLGVNPAALTNRFSFAKGEGWQSLAHPLPRGEGDSFAGRAVNGDNARSGSKVENPPAANEIEIPAIGDANSIQWAMHKKVGDTIDYVDERGQPFKVRIVGAVANSILQGQLIIDEAEFVKRFPGESGYRMFLIDAPSNAVNEVSAALSRAMQDVGLELTPTVQRLAQFNAVQNTYLGTFQVLGGLGLLLGSVGLGIVVLRNVLERRGELALMIALGFRKATLQSLLLMENGALLLAGLATGVVAAAVAVLPAVLSPSAQLPYGSLSLTLAAVLVNGALWTWAATKLAVRGDLLKALRNE